MEEIEAVPPHIQEAMDTMRDLLWPPKKEEHLEPAVGAVLQFVEHKYLPQNVVGYRWRVYEVHWSDFLRMAAYRMWREDDQGQCLQLTQDWMDRCGRLLV